MKISVLSFLILISALFGCQNQDTLIGDAYFEAGNYAEAIESYNEFLRLNPRHIKTIYNRGRCYQELGQYDKALEDFNLVLEYDSYNDNALLSIGQEFYRKGEYTSTVYYSEKVIEHNANNAMAHYLLGRANHKQGLLRDALNNYNTAINLDPNLGEAYLHRGALKLYMKQKNLACQDLQKAANMNVEGAADAVKKNCK